MAIFNEVNPLENPCCAKILPLVYDDTLSYYEELCKVVLKENEIIGEFNKIIEYSDNAVTTATEQATIATTKAEEASESAATASADATSASVSATKAEELVSNTASKIDVFSARLDAVIPTGTQTEGNTELIDIRAGFNGATYDSAGNAVRACDTILNNSIDELKSDVSDLNYYNVLKDGSASSGSNKYASWNVNASDLSVTLTAESETSADTVAFSYYPYVADPATLPEFVDFNVNYTLVFNSSNSLCMLQFYYLFEDGTKKMIYYSNSGVYNFSIPSNTKALGIRCFIKKGFSGVCNYKAIIFATVPKDNVIVTDMYNNVNAKAHVENLVFSPLYTLDRDTTLGTYRVQAITYDTKRNHFVIVGGSTLKNGDSFICFTDTLENFKTAEKTIIHCGHSNDITYNSTDDVLVIAVGGNTDSSGAIIQEGDVLPNTLIVLDPETAEIESTKVLDFGGCFGIEYHDGNYYFSDNENIYLLDSNLENPVKLFSCNKADIVSYLGLTDEDYVLRQGIIYYNDKIYMICSSKNDVTHSYHDACALAEYSLIDKKLLKIHSSYIQKYEETEGACIYNDNLYIVSDGNFFISGYVSKISETLITNAYKQIPQNSDINNYLSLGKFFCASRTHAATLVNIPSDLVVAFTLYVDNSGSNNRRQFIVPVTDGVMYTRFYSGTDKAWGPWFKFNGTPVD